MKESEISMTAMAGFGNWISCLWKINEKRMVEDKNNSSTFQTQKNNFGIKSRGTFVCSHCTRLTFWRWTIQVVVEVTALKRDEPGRRLWLRRSSSLLALALVPVGHRCWAFPKFGWSFRLQSCWSRCLERLQMWGGFLSDLPQAVCLTSLHLRWRAGGWADVVLNGLSVCLNEERTITNTLKCLFEIETKKQ